MTRVRSNSSKWVSLKTALLKVNITVDYLWGQGSTERLQQLAAELAQRDLEVIVTSGPQPVRALLAANTKTPIVFAILADPISDGFVQSLARPGGNITGLSMSGRVLTDQVEMPPEWLFFQ